MKPNQRSLRFAVASAFGVLLTMLALYLALGSASSVLRAPQTSTRSKLRKTDLLLAEFRAKNGVHAPDLNAAGLGDYWRDGWERPFLYSLSNGAPLVESLGRDGVRGGVGLDADVSNRTPRPPESRVSASQLLFLPLGMQLAAVSLACGVLGAVVVFGGLKDQSFALGALPSLLAQLGAALLIALFGAMFILIAHIPSGH